MTTVFLDTDVLLDFLLDRQPFNNHARQIFNLADLAQIEILISALSIANASYVLARFVKTEQRMNSITQILAFVKICPLSAVEIHQALSLNFKDYEDGLQYATAVVNKADILVSRNVADFKKSLIPVMTPEVFLKSTLP